MKLFATLPLLLLVACATTSSEPTSLRQRFDKADLNSDGKVTRDEAGSLMVGEAFTMFDADKDGFVDEQEFVASGGTAEQFRKINRSGTGKATLAEALANPAVFERMTTPFDEADGNGDGAIDYEELMSYRIDLENAVR